MVEHVSELIFERAIKESLGGRKEMTVRTVEQLLQVVPAHALVRKHYSGDFCIMLPLLRCVNFIPAEALQNLPLPPFTPLFSAESRKFSSQSVLHHSPTTSWKCSLLFLVMGLL